MFYLQEVDGYGRRFYARGKSLGCGEEKGAEEAQGGFKAGDKAEVYARVVLVLT